MSGLKVAGKNTYAFTNTWESIAQSLNLYLARWQQEFAVDNPPSGPFGV
jgi:hypothetical protein